jgi:histidinol-phosphatase (PHP family)
VINSVHTLHGNDYCRGVPYRTEDGQVRPKREVYEEYFALVKRSVEADFEYDIVGHVGYCTRYAPYEDKGASYEEFPNEWDGVLKAVIERDKILEINTSNKLGVSPTLPDRDILERYFALGGRKVSIGSDAHFKERILDKRELTVEMLKNIGFTAVTVPVCGDHVRVEI